MNRLSTLPTVIDLARSDRLHHTPIEMLDTCGGLSAKIDLALTEFADTVVTFMPDSANCSICSITCTTVIIQYEFQDEPPEISTTTDVAEVKL